jgi:hypothetical protein
MTHVRHPGQTKHDGHGMRRINGGPTIYDKKKKIYLKGILFNFSYK